jgi:hypothetical protein
MISALLHGRDDDRLTDDESRCRSRSHRQTAAENEQAGRCPTGTAVL